MWSLHAALLQNRIVKCWYHHAILDDHYYPVTWQLRQEVERLTDTLTKPLRIRARAWLAKLQEPTSNAVWKKQRNLHARLLLEQVRSGCLDVPFTAMPPAGQLPNLAQCNTYRYMSPRGGSDSSSPCAAVGRHSTSAEQRSVRDRWLAHEGEEVEQQPVTLAAALRRLEAEMGGVSRVGSRAPRQMSASGIAEAFQLNRKLFNASYDDGSGRNNISRNSPTGVKEAAAAAASAAVFGSSKAIHVPCSGGYSVRGLPWHATSAVGGSSGLSLGSVMPVVMAGNLRQSLEVACGEAELLEWRLYNTQDQVAKQAESIASACQASRRHAAHVQQVTKAELDAVIARFERGKGRPMALAGGSAELGGQESPSYGAPVAHKESPRCSTPGVLQERSNSAGDSTGTAAAVPPANGCTPPDTDLWQAPAAAVHSVPQLPHPTGPAGTHRSAVAPLAAPCAPPAPALPGLQLVRRPPAAGIGCQGGGVQAFSDDASAGELAQGALRFVTLTQQAQLASSTAPSSGAGQATTTRCSSRPEHSGAQGAFGHGGGAAGGAHVASRLEPLLQQHEGVLRVAPAAARRRAVVPLPDYCGSHCCGSPSEAVAKARLQQPPRGSGGQSPAGWGPRHSRQGGDLKQARCPDAASQLLMARRANQQGTTQEAEGAHTRPRPAATDRTAERAGLDDVGVALSAAAASSYASRHMAAVQELLRELCHHAAAMKLHLQVVAASVPQPPGPADGGQATAAAPHNLVLQSALSFTFERLQRSLERLVKQLGRPPATTDLSATVRRHLTPSHRPWSAGRGGRHTPITAGAALLPPLSAVSLRQACVTLRQAAELVTQDVRALLLQPAPAVPPPVPAGPVSGEPEQSQRQSKGESGTGHSSAAATGAAKDLAHTTGAITAGAGVAAHVSEVVSYLTEQAGADVRRELQLLQSLVHRTCSELTIAAANSAAATAAVAAAARSIPGTREAWRILGSRRSASAPPTQRRTAPFCSEAGGTKANSIAKGHAWQDLPTADKQLKVQGGHLFSSAGPVHTWQQPNAVGAGREAAPPACIDIVGVGGATGSHSTGAGGAIRAAAQLHHLHSLPLGRLPQRPNALALGAHGHGSCTSPIWPDSCQHGSTDTAVDASPQDARWPQMAAATAVPVWRQAGATSCGPQQPSVSLVPDQTGPQSLRNTPLSPHASGWCQKRWHAAPAPNADPITRHPTGGHLSPSSTTYQASRPTAAGAATPHLLSWSRFPAKLTSPCPLDASTLRPSSRGRYASPPAHPALTMAASHARSHSWEPATAVPRARAGSVVPAGGLASLFVMPAELSSGPSSSLAPAARGLPQAGQLGTCTAPVREPSATEAPSSQPRGGGGPPISSSLETRDRPLQQAEGAPRSLQYQGLRDSPTAPLPSGAHHAEPASRPAAETQDGGAEQRRGSLDAEADRQAEELLEGLRRQGFALRGRVIGGSSVLVSDARWGGLPIASASCDWDDSAGAVPASALQPRRLLPAMTDAGLQTVRRQQPPSAGHRCGHGETVRALGGTASGGSSPSGSGADAPTGASATKPGQGASSPPHGYDASWEATGQPLLPMSGTGSHAPAALRTGGGGGGSGGSGSVGHGGSIGGPALQTGYKWVRGRRGIMGWPSQAGHAEAGGGTKPQWQGEGTGHGLGAGVPAGNRAMGHAAALLPHERHRAAAADICASLINEHAHWQLRSGGVHGVPLAASEQRPAPAPVEACWHPAEGLVGYSDPLGGSSGQLPGEQQQCHRQQHVSQPYAAPQCSFVQYSWCCRSADAACAVAEGKAHAAALSAAAAWHRRQCPGSPQAAPSAFHHHCISSPRCSGSGPAEGAHTSPTILQGHQPQCCTAATQHGITAGPDVRPSTQGGAHSGSEERYWQLRATLDIPERCGVPRQPLAEPEYWRLKQDLGSPRA